MGFAADAISDLIAPPPTRPDPGPPQRDDGQASFDDHLAARSNDPPPRPERPERPDRPDRPDRGARSDASDTTRDAHQPQDRDTDKVKAPDRPGKDTDTKDTAPSQNDEQAAQAASAQQQTKTAAPAKADQPSPLTQILAHLAAQEDAKNEAPPPQEGDAQTPQQQAGAAQAQPALPATQMQAAGKTHAKPATAGKTTANPKHEDAKDAAAAPTDVKDAAQAATAQAATAQAAPAAQTAPDPKLGQTNAQPTPDGAQALAVQTPSPQQNPPQTPQPRDPLAIDANTRGAQNIPLHAPTPKAEPASDKPSGAKITGAAAVQAAAKENFTLPSAAADATPAQNSTPASAALAAPSSATPADIASDAGTAARAAPASSQVGREIIRRSATGSTRFEMRLDPPGLGKVDVRLEISRDHKVTAVISADNPQALNDLQRGARDLQQSLQQAGLDLSDDGLSFDLSQQNFAQANSSDQQQQRGSNGPQSNNTPATAETAPVTTRPLSIDSWRGGRVDLVA